MASLKQRADEAKERWHSQNAAYIINAVLELIQRQGSEGAEEIRRELTPKMRQILTRPERETARGYIKNYFETTIPKVVRAVKKVIGRVFGQIVRQKVRMQMYIYRYRIKEATPELHRKLIQRQQLLVAVKKLRTQVNHQIHALGHTNRELRSMENYMDELRYNTSKIKASLPSSSRQAKFPESSDSDEEAIDEVFDEIKYRQGY